MDGAFYPTSPVIPVSEGRSYLGLVNTLGKYKMLMCTINHVCEEKGGVGMEVVWAEGCYKYCIYSLIGSRVTRETRHKGRKAFGHFHFFYGLQQGVKMHIVPLAIPVFV